MSIQNFAGFVDLELELAFVDPELADFVDFDSCFEVAVEPVQ
ncbi:hypothetical protein [Desulfosporosinus sp. Sb-LF]|nr:hypothetical protein [Desulfosporosinus sp. Sb-LF]